MSIKKEKIPIVRFKDFSEPWFQNQLSEVAEFSKGRGYSKKDLQFHGTPIILYGRLYTSYESVISNVETYANLEENSVVSEGGEVIIPASGESADDISRASCVIDRGIILGGDLNIVRPREYLNSLFIAITLSNGSQQRELSKRAQGKSVVHLHNSDLKAVKLFYPSYEEQSAIGSLFRILDDLLASYKDNLVNYQSLKMTMLSKIFPKAGQTVPEIRLDGFDGEWEIKRADEIFKSVSEKNKALLPVLSASQIDGMVLRDEIGIDIKYDEATLNNYKVVKPGQFVIHLRSFQGGFALSKLEGITSPAYTIIDFIDKKNNIPDFWNSILTSRDFIKRLETVTYGIRDGKSISFKEQQAIGAYFSNLDNLINSYQEKITQLETLKKKLLQDMFI